jgi:hypothetical protein
MAGAGQAQTAAPSSRPDAAWLKAAKYGVFFHYLPGGPGWQQAIDSFDVEAFAGQMEQAGPDYVFITLGQNNGYYCAPNQTYETLTGHAPHERCSRRDLPMELADALARRHIRLMLYLPSRSPQQDKAAMQALADVNEQQPAPQEFTRKWSEVIREWSLHYGPKVSGWWFDGAYNTAGWDDLHKSYNWTTWAAACRVGNPRSLLAFNPGTDLKHAFTALTAEQYYTAGEQNDWTATPQKFPPPPGVQWQVLGFLGTHWAAADGPRLTDAAMIDYIRTVNAQGGTVTMDVHVSPDGQVFPAHLRQLIAIKQALRGP